MFRLYTLLFFLLDTLGYHLLSILVFLFLALLFLLCVTGLCSFFAWRLEVFYSFWTFLKDTMRFLTLPEERKNQTSFLVPSRRTFLLLGYVDRQTCFLGYLSETFCAELPVLVSSITSIFLITAVL